MLKRWPQGVDGGPFYHKRPGKAWKGDLADIRFPSQRPGQMAVVRDLGDVVTMAQLNCLDLNPWPVRAEDTNHPDELRIDLDPTEGVAFSEVDIMAQSRRRGEMVERAGGRTSVPQIFIDGRHVGGCDELYALDARGELDPLLQQAEAG